MSVFPSNIDLEQENKTDVYLCNSADAIDEVCGYEVGRQFTRERR